MTQSSLPPAGWYDDPDGAGLRWWDGERWTEHVQSRKSIVPVTTTDVARDRAGVLGGGYARLSAEARALRIVVILIVGAALIFGGIQFTDWVTEGIEQQRQEVENPFGY